MNLEYFIASLPMLLPGHPAKITADAFRNSCTTSLGPSLTSAVEALFGNGISGHSFVTAWLAHDTALRAAIAARRAAKRHTQFLQQGRDTSYDSAVAAAFSESDPLRRENALDRIRWQIADDMQGVQPISENVVLAYAIKLQMAIRQQERDAEIGRKRFEDMAEMSRNSNLKSEHTV